MKSFVRVAVLLTVLAGLAAFSLQASAQQAPGSQQPTATQPQSQQPNDMQNQASQPMSGTIVKEKGKLVLKDSASGTSYKLDDQDKAKQFEGKQVKVTGKLDSSTNQIHVENIEPSQP
jgi:uncharacterized protein YdeI (BOF family)